MTGTLEYAASILMLKVHEPTNLYLTSLNLRECIESVACEI